MQELRLHSYLAATAKASIKLWYYCRAISDNGRAKFSISEICRDLNISRKTLRYYLSTCSEYFHSIQKEGSTYTCYYKSLTSLTSYWGPTAYITLKELQTYKVSATEIAIQALQASSRKLASLSSKAKLAKPESFFEPSALSLGAIHKNTLYVGQSFVLYGASHRGVATRLGLSESTVTRRLKNTKKIRLAKFSYTNLAEYNILAEEWSPKLGRFRRFHGRLYKLHTNIYYPAFSLTSMKRRKAEVLKALDPN